MTAGTGCSAIWRCGWRGSAVSSSADLDREPGLAGLGELGLPGEAADAVRLPGLRVLRAVVEAQARVVLGDDRAGDRLGVRVTGGGAVGGDQVQRGADALEQREVDVRAAAVVGQLEGVQREPFRAVVEHPLD